MCRCHVEVGIPRSIGARHRDCERVRARTDDQHVWLRRHSSAQRHDPRTGTIADWAIDRAASSSSGVDAVHVWAYPFLGETLGTPQFVAAATVGMERPDVARIFGSQFLTAEFESVSSRPFPAGAYLIVVSARQASTQSFVAVATVRVHVTQLGLNDLTGSSQSPLWSGTEWICANTGSGPVGPPGPPGPPGPTGPMGATLLCAPTCRG